jgi:hypothetical protein
MSALSTAFSHKVTMADGRVIEAHSDQRDIAAFEGEPFGCGFFQIAEKPFTFARYVAWRGSKRAKLHNFTWEEWGEQCVTVEELEDDDDTADPGMTVASAGA